jgi:hypothetical protein
MKKLFFILSLTVGALNAQTTYVIQSKTPVTYNLPNKVIGADTASVIGVINSWCIDAGFQNYTFYYSYMKSDMSAPIYSGSFNISGSAIDALYDEIKGDLPYPITSWRDYLQLAAYNGMIYQAALTWNKPMSNFEIKVH